MYVKPSDQYSLALPVLSVSCAELFLWVIRKSTSSAMNHERELMKINLFTSVDNSEWAPETDISLRMTCSCVLPVSRAQSLVRHFVLARYDAPTYLKRGGEGI